MEVSQPDRVAVEPIDVGRLDPWIARTPEVGVTLVVGDHDDDVRLVVASTHCLVLFVRCLTQRRRETCQTWNLGGYGSVVMLGGVLRMRERADPHGMWRSRSVRRSAEQGCKNPGCPLRPRKPVGEQRGAPALPSPRQHRIRTHCLH